MSMEAGSYLNRIPHYTTDDNQNSDPEYSLTCCQLSYRMSAIAPVIAGLAAGIAFIVIFSSYSSLTIDRGNSVLQEQQKVISITKDLSIVKEFLKRYPGANTKVNENFTDISKKDDLKAIVTYSVERDLYPSEGHRALKLTVLVDKNYTVISNGMTCLGPVSSELSRVEPDMWIEAENCITKITHEPTVQSSKLP